MAADICARIVAVVCFFSAQEGEVTGECDLLLEYCLAGSMLYIALARLRNVLVNFPVDSLLTRGTVVEVAIVAAAVAIRGPAMSTSPGRCMLTDLMFANGGFARTHLSI